ncbi:MAG: tRNA lysidine(34) synthetase TilS [Candidatus Aminicenantes bacterium]|nr:MAG: tRNA lysidine(34) synthetase TilS [Candidatus Aminicenantes bacterium]
MSKLILETFKTTIQEYGLLEKKDNILIAYSGGLDSTGLLALLLELREEWDFSLFLGHFNHKLRQKADEDEKFVKQIARKFSIPLFVGRKDIRNYATSRRINLEEAGREVRYNFLKKTALKIGKVKIATAHTMTDQAETFLMRLMRGSGLRGLGGIFPVKDEIIIRPLIQIEREDIELYLEKKKMSFRMDETNFDRRFLRNRIRLDLIPHIRKNFEPQIVSQLGKIASIIREENAFLEKIGKEKAQRSILRENDQHLLDWKLLSSLPKALARRVVQEFIFDLKGNLREISLEDVDSVLSLKEGKERPIKKDLVLRREQGLIFLKKKPHPKIKYEYSWNGRSPLEISELKLRFIGKRVEKGESPLRFDDKTTAFLDHDNLRFPLLVRSRRDGDRYRPLGAPGQKKLKEIMRAKRIPLRERDRRPVFLSGDEIVWILGLAVSEKFKVRDGSSNIFIINKL